MCFRQLPSHDWSQLRGRHWVSPLRQLPGDDLPSVDPLRRGWPAVAGGGAQEVGAPGTEQLAEKLPVEGQLQLQHWLGWLAAAQLLLEGVGA